MLNIQDLKSGQFYRNGHGQLVYLLKIVFEDTISKHLDELEELQRVPAYDHIVYRIIKPGRFDLPHNSKYSWLSPSEKFYELVDVEIVFQKNDHFIINDDIPYLLSIICGPAYSSVNIHSQAKAYKFPYRFVLGKDGPGDRNPAISMEGIPRNAIETIIETLGFQSFMYFSIVGPSMTGGNTIPYGFSFHFKNEEDYNLARLIVPKKC